MVMSATNDHLVESGGKTPPKASLVCPACGHTSHVDGDWAVTEYDVGERRRLVYECPECWQTVVVQPVFEEPPLLA